MSTRMFQKAGLLVVLSAVIFMNAVAAGQPKQSTGLPSNASGSAASALIGEAKATEIALDQAGGGEVVGMKLKQSKHGASVYSALVVDGGSRIMVRVDATSGVVVKFDRKNIERVEYPKRRQTAQAWPETAVTFGKAREIALERTGGGTVIEAKKEFKKNGRILYEVEVIDAGRKCEVEIDAQTGAIVEYQEELSHF